MLAQAAQDADPRRTPQRGGGVETANIKPFTHDNAGAEEADTRDDLRGHAAGAGRIGGHGAENKDRRAGRHQRIGAQAGHTLAPLALGANHRAQAHCQQ